jgi:four helix bundle protein
MSMSSKADDKKLEDHEVWRTASQLAASAYAVLDQLPEEEKWGITLKLRRDAFDMTSSLAEAFGSIDPRDQKYHFGIARRHMYSLKNTYLIAHKTDVLKLDPEAIVKLNAIIGQTNKEITDADKAIPTYMKQFESPEKPGKKELA